MVGNPSFFFIHALGLMGYGGLMGYSGDTEFATQGSTGSELVNLQTRHALENRGAGAGGAVSAPLTRPRKSPGVRVIRLSPD